MKTIRPLRTVIAVFAMITGLIMFGLGAQDLLHYYGAIRRGWTEWAVSGQGLWQLSNGAVELAATVLLAILAARVLGTKYARQVPVS